jgi:hypothetical protein
MLIKLQPTDQRSTLVGIGYKKCLPWAVQLNLSCPPFPIARVFCSTNVPGIRDDVVDYRKLLLVQLYHIFYCKPQYNYIKNYMFIILSYNN